MKKILTLIVIVFVGLCAWLILEATLSVPEGAQGPYLLLQQTTSDAASQTARPVPDTLAQDPAPPAEPRRYGASGGSAQTVTLGDTYEESGYKFALELTTRGAAIRSATFSEHKDRDPDDPQPLVFLWPVSMGANREILSLATQGFILVDQRQKLRLNQLDWKLLEEKTAGSQHSAQFEALITDDTATPVIRLTKTYRVTPDSYLLDCDIALENLGSTPQNVYMDLSGPTGLEKEGFRSDLRKPVAAFRDAQGKIGSSRFEIKELKKATSVEARGLNPPTNTTPLWVATVNKYFAAIVVPLADDGLEPGDWLLRRTAVYYNPDGDLKTDRGDETIGLDLRTRPLTLAPKGQVESKEQYRCQIYLGPKDKSLFDKNERFNQLGFLETIDFMGCCCPKSVIYPLAFAILGLMKLMFGIIPNYGIVIIILVFLVRLLMHPVTKKSQVSMHKMSRLAPKAEEIKKRYASNKAEMNKQMMALYKEQGASPVMGFLPMFIQMPVWIALWSAVNASVDLRGAAFLPFWITDLSMPDALIRFSGFELPIFGSIESFNLLPILMGVAFYLQQKLMPNQAAAASNPQMAQQQKMMQIMMPILFPLMLYKVASGVNLYIMTSTFVGVMEQHLIRKHIREKEAADAQGLVAVTSKTGGKVKKKKPKPMFKQ